MTLPPVSVIDLFPGEREAFLSLLSELSPAEWDLPTICVGWTVKDVALHLLGCDVGRLSRGRDGFTNPDFATGLDISMLPGLIEAIDRQNDRWVLGLRRMSPQLLIEFIRLVGDETNDYFRGLDEAALGGPVDWAGPEPAPVWLDLAREYTERWHHQQHIRDAVGRPGLKERHWFGPVLATFVHGLERPLSRLDLPVGSELKLTITGEAGGVWYAYRGERRWELGLEAVTTASTTVELDQEIAWRLFTKGLDPEEAKRRAAVEGDLTLANAVFDTVSILA
jgi:uncharacterized protein (TIGR03083 family)